MLWLRRMKHIWWLSNVWYLDDRRHLSHELPHKLSSSFGRGKTVIRVHCSCSKTLNQRSKITAIGIIWNILTSSSTWLASWQIACNYDHRWASSILSLFNKWLKRYKSRLSLQYNVNQHKLITVYLQWLRRTSIPSNNCTK